MEGDLSREELREELETMGLTRVREELADMSSSYFYPSDIPIVEAWLKEKEEEEKKENFSKELEVAKESNRIARSAKNASWWAIGISIVSIIISILIIIFKK